MSKPIIPIQKDSAWRGTADCTSCGVREMVLFADLSTEDFEHIHAPIDDLEFAMGEVLQRGGDAAASMMTLRAGMVKLVRSTVDGRQRIVRVLRPGDVIGPEAVVGGHYDNDAVALTNAKVCRIPVHVIEDLVKHTPKLYHKLMEKWHRSLQDADDWLAELNFGTARQRVAGLVRKMRAHGDASVVTLFSREDMGAMLDLKLETVSRTINAFVREGLLEPLDKVGRVYRIVDIRRLQDPDA
jgi:CRP-like cAMP-binding protein